MWVHRSKTAVTKYKSNIKVERSGVAELDKLNMTWQLNI